MKPVDAHLADILRTVRELTPIPQRLLEAQGCALAADVVARLDLPPFDNSAMDGYAVRAADVAAARERAPVELPVVGDVAAGSDQATAVAPGLAVRIMTGAAVPHGADAVVPVELTDGGVARVRVREPVGRGAHIRRRGEDVVVGATLVSAGTRLGSREIALLAAAGYDQVLARPRPRVVVIGTGSELVEPGGALGRGRIYDSNSYSLAAAAVEAGAVAYRVGFVRDDPQLFATTLEDQLVRADLVVTSGGVSVGAYDIVKEVLSRRGTVAFDRVAMQPGMPQGFGTIGEDATPIFTLPGNPVSSWISFEVFVRPAIRKMLGVTPYQRPRVAAVAAEEWTAPPDKRQYARVRYEVGADGVARVRPTGGSGSHLVANLTAANALAVVPEDITRVKVGTRLDVLLLDGGSPR